jgi:dipeptidyl aminopeptidase/acylaminoacyl peptidase
MYKPHDFDPARKYPVIEYVYGGPQVAVVDHGFAIGQSFASAPMQLAQLGCICMMLDARGTPERSKAFHDVVYKDWATALVADHAAAIRQLAKKYAFIDGTRVGVTGGSWGGYSSTRLLLEAPDVYRCAVSAAPGYDPYASVLYECYLGLPQDNPEAYRAANVIPLAPKLAGALMIVCGTADHFCWPDAMKMAEALIRAGKDHEFVVLPEQGHGSDSQHGAYSDQKLAAFFAKHLAMQGEVS